MSQQQKWKFQVASHLLKWMNKIHFVFIAREVWSLWTPFPKSLHSSLHPHTTTKHSLPTPQIPGTALLSHKQALLQKPTLLSPTTPCPSWCNHLPCLSLMANLYTRLQLLNFSSGKEKVFLKLLPQPFFTTERSLLFFFFFFKHHWVAIFLPHLLPVLVQLLLRSHDVLHRTPAVKGGHHSVLH